MKVGKNPTLSLKSLVNEFIEWRLLTVVGTWSGIKELGRSFNCESLASFFYFIIVTMLYGKSTSQSTLQVSLVSAYIKMKALVPGKGT